MASYTFTVNPNQPYIPVTFFGPNNRPVVINVKIDTGADNIKVDTKYAPLLGIKKLTDGEAFTSYGAEGKAQGSVYLHPIRIQVGTLKPIDSEVLIGPARRDLFGMVKAIGVYQLKISATKATFTELQIPNEVVKNMFKVRRYNNIRGDVT